MITFISGLPGKGKNVIAVADAIKYHRNTSKLPFIFKFFRLFGYKTKLEKANFDLYKHLEKEGKTVFEYQRERGLAGSPGALCAGDSLISTLVFSNFPILLERKKVKSNSGEIKIVEVYSQKIDFSSLSIDKKDSFYYPKGSMVIIDEVQRFASNRDFSDKVMKEKIKPISIFLQHHRHGDISKIYFVTQNPTRTDLNFRQLSESYDRLKRFFRFFIKIPAKINFTPSVLNPYIQKIEFDFPIIKKHVNLSEFEFEDKCINLLKSGRDFYLGFVLSTGVRYFNEQDYGLPIPDKFNKGSALYEYKRIFRFTSINRVFHAYDSKYFRVVFENFKTGMYLSYTDLEFKDYMLDNGKIVGVQ